MQLLNKTLNTCSICGRHFSAPWQNHICPSCSLKKSLAVTEEATRDNSIRTIKKKGEITQGLKKETIGQTTEMRLKRGRENKSGLDFNNPEDKNLYQRNWTSLHREQIREKRRAYIKTIKSKNSRHIHAHVRWQHLKKRSLMPLW